MKIDFTPRQQAAIDALGGDILVSAAAGSGKTAVLTQRVIKRMIYDVPPISADRLMIVTFTNAAAAEMKMRILQKLNLICEEFPENSLAQKQLNLFSKIKIGTIHSVCMDLLRENFSALGLPADFRIGGMEEINLLRDMAAEKVLEDAYSEGNPVFLDLAELMGDKKTDEKFQKSILKILDFASSFPFYKDWFGKKLDWYKGFAKPEESVWADIIFKKSLSVISACLKINERIFEIIQENPELDPYQLAAESDRAILTEFNTAITQRDWDLCFNLSQNISFSSLKAAKGADESVKNSVKILRENIKTRLKSFSQKLFITDKTGFREDIDDLLPKIQELFDLVLKTDSIISKEKPKAKIIDFADLEQLSLKLLVTSENGKFVKTPLALELGENVEEIMIDEYQDVNSAQDTILNAIARGNNRFMVGDIKQSIYRFRQAMPELFIDMLLNFNQEGSGKFPQKILLNGNFRTEKSLTNTINTIFQNIMSRELGDIPYDEEQALIPYAKYPPTDTPSFEAILIENDTDELNSLNLEAKIVAQRIKELINSKACIKDGEISRPIEAGDIAILLRSPKNKANAFKKALAQLEVSAESAQAEDFLTSYEIQSLFNLLAAIENPTRSIELTGAMLSPIFGFTDDLLTELKLKYPAATTYSSLCLGEDDENFREFKAYFDSLHRFSASHDVPSLIWKILSDTDFYLVTLAGENGIQKRANLNMFLEYSYEYKRRGYVSLSSFVRILSRLYEKEEGLDAPSGSDRNAVTITSIHRSKGLEWPVVFISDTSKTFGFYSNDMKETYVLNNELGFASVRREKSLKCQFNSVPLMALKSINEQQSLSEEMRVLYVGATRAKEKLFITGVTSKPTKKLEEFSAFGDGAYPPQLVSGYHSFMDWVLMGLLKGKSAQEALEVDEGRVIRILNSRYLIEGEKNSTPTDQGACDQELKNELLTRINFQYPFKTASEIPVKIAASKFAGNLKTAFAFTKTPEFIRKSKGGTKKGNAMHRFMQLCNLQRAANSPLDEIKNLLAKNLISQEEAALIDIHALENIFSGEIGKIMLSADTVLREHRFFAPASCSPLTVSLTDGLGNYCMLEGVADLIAIKDGKLFIIDYKTDRVENKEALKALYEPQILLYRDMLRQNFSMPIEGAYIYSFTLSCEISF